MFFDKDGILNIDEQVANNESFKKIMEDGIVTEEEIMAQSAKVQEMLQSIEKKYKAEQVEEIKELLVESSVLYAIFNYHSIQNLKE